MDEIGNALKDELYQDLPAEAQRLHDLSDEDLVAEVVRWEGDSDHQLALILRAARVKYASNNEYGRWRRDNLPDIERHVAYSLIQTHQRFHGTPIWGMGRSKRKLLVSAPKEVIDEVVAQAEKGVIYTVRQLSEKLSIHRSTVEEPNEKVQNNLKAGEADRAAADRADTARELLTQQDKQRADATKASKEEHKMNVLRRASEERSNSASYQQLGFGKENLPVNTTIRQLRENLVKAYDPSNFKGIPPQDQELLKSALAEMLKTFSDILPPELKEVG